MTALYQQRVVALNKQRIIEHIKAGKPRSELSTQLNNALGSYTKPSSRCLDPDFSKTVRELAPHYFRDYLSKPKKRTPAVVAQATAFVANAAQQTAWVVTTPEVISPSAPTPVGCSEPPRGGSDNRLETPMAFPEPVKAVVKRKPKPLPPTPARKSIWQRIGEFF